MTHGSLFSGIGGFDLATEWMGWQNVFHCEWNTFGQKVLKHYWPNAISYNDITKTDFTIHRGCIDILTGGFPCQPYSMAGKRLGKEDDRHLWPEMLRAIREIQPRWVVGENVLGLVNWSDGLVFHEVQADLEAEGYEVQPFVLAAASVGAPHRRDRVWFVAYAKLRTDRLPTERGMDMERTILEGREWKKETNRFDIKPKNVADTKSIRLERTMANREMDREKRFAFSPKWDQWFKRPASAGLCSRNDGISSRLDGITFSKWRQESIKAGGNAVVPQVVLSIFRTIAEYEKMHAQ